MWPSSTGGFRISGSRFLLTFGAIALFAALGSTPAQAALTIDTTNPADWIISNGTLKLDWNSANGHVFGVFLNGVNLVDTTNRSMGLYMDNTGSIGGGTPTVGFHQGGNSYIDWWITSPAAGANAFTFTQHFILTDNSTGFSVYCIADHPASAPTAGLGQIQYVFRISRTLFDTSYFFDPALNNPSELIIPRANIPASAVADPGRRDLAEVLDLHGIPQPAGYTRQFANKYDTTVYQYLHRGDGAFGSSYGAWTILPSRETLPGGPTHQSLAAGDLLIMESLSGHLDNPLNFSVPSGVNESRRWGPFYFHFNQFTSNLPKPSDLYFQAVVAGQNVAAVWDNDEILTGLGYVPMSQRGTVAPTISGAGSDQPNTSWIVLSDQHTDTQLSAHGLQYWTTENAAGNAVLAGVTPGTYRLSAYVLGQWGEMRLNGVTVNSNQQTDLPGLTFVPENFSTDAPIWTIGTPDRSAHEFLHGHDSTGQDDKEYFGNWNYWLDLAANNGAVVYNATDGPGYTATNNLDAWYYVQWPKFNPALFAGVFNPADDTTDGYKYIVPAFVGDPATAAAPPWTVHFTTTSAQLAQGQHAVLSVALAAAQGDVIATLNGRPTLIYRPRHQSDAMVRSGLSGYTQWLVMQWPTSALAPAGEDNVLTLGTNRGGIMYDALRFEITDASADPAVRGWHDYDFLEGNTVTPSNDSLDNP